MILIVTRKDDVHADLVARHLLSAKIPFFRLNTECADEYRFAIGVESGQIENRVSGLSLDLLNVTSVWLRRRSFIGSIPENLKSFVEAEWAGLYRDIWLLLEDRFWMSWPFAIELAKNKINQIRLAKKIGFDIPPTCFTNSIEEAVAFQREMGVCVYKPNDGGAFDSNGNLAVYTSIIDKNLTASPEMDEMLKICPGIFQPYLDKKFELRINVVKDRVFATRIDSQASDRTKIDWRRYSFSETLHSQFALSSELEDMCRRIVSCLNLSFGAIDMVVTPEEKFYFLEINPNGQWAWIEALTGQNISGAIADTLANFR